jgi:hypothetical protein
VKVGRYLSFGCVVCLAWELTFAAPPRRFRSYVGTLDHESVTLAWGTTEGGDNTIGREARGIGKVQVQVGDKTVDTDKSFARIGGLDADKEYPYKIRLNGEELASGTVRTWPKKTNRIVFFVFGDWGSGDSGQRALGEKMASEMERLAKEGKPVRFVLSTGDNIYGTYNIRHTGSDDSHWEEKFFAPYEKVLSKIPFYATIGNHDGNETENRRDLAVYLDNFFFPTGEKSRWYKFDIGELMEVFALDSSRNQLESNPAPVYLPDSEQSKWLRDQLAKSEVPWKVAVFHHPMFTAGPRHPAVRKELDHWFQAFQKSGVKVVFNGHEHNFQASVRNPQTGSIQFVVSGAGGELRKGSVRRYMKDAGIAAWMAQRHFCIVEVTENEMTIEPVSTSEASVQDASGNAVKMPLRVPRLEIGPASSGGSAKD